jgi:glutaredoxin 3
VAKVKIYTTPFCVYCRMAKVFFKKHSIQYEEFDVANDSEARENMIRASHQMGVPVIVVNDKIFVGFNPSELKRALKVE